MGPLGWQETLVIFVLVLLLFGPKKLPEVGKNIAKAIGEFRRASSELKDTWHREMATLEKETQEIRKEAESLTQVTSEYTSDTSYNYDSSYDYGGYGYPESSDSLTTTTTDSSTVSASASLGADSTGEAVETAEASPHPVAAEGAVPTSSSDTAAPTDPPAEQAAAR
jgi:TatA/E family protein of Tat protein translocase